MSQNSDAPLSFKAQCVHNIVAKIAQSEKEKEKTQRRIELASLAWEMVLSFGVGFAVGAENVAFIAALVVPGFFWSDADSRLRERVKHQDALLREYKRQLAIANGDYTSFP